MKIKVQLTRSLIGRKPNQVKTAHSMGLFKINDIAELEANAANLGKVNTIKHLIEQEEIK